MIEMAMGKKDRHWLEFFFRDNLVNLGSDIRTTWIDNDALISRTCSKYPTIGGVHWRWMHSNQHKRPPCAP
jgi:hypothetical protein